MTKPTAEPKPRRGRPTLTEKPGQRFMIHIPPKVAEQLRALGAGSISRGVIRLASAHPDMPIATGPAPRTVGQMKALERSRARAQKALDVVNKMLSEKLQGEPS